MKKFLRVASLVGLCWLEPAHAACEPKSEPLAEAKPGPVSRSEIGPVLIDPPIGTPVRQDTVLAVDVEYQIAGFRSDVVYTLAADLKINEYATRSVRHNDDAVSVPLKFAAGKARICVPLAQTYRDDADDVAWPLEIGFSIFSDDGGGMTGVAGSRMDKLNSVDAPAAALARQAKAPPPEYEDALEHVFHEFTKSAALYKACLKRFPELQPKLTPAYRTWETRHKADIDFVMGLKFEAFKSQAGGRADAAMLGLDSMAEIRQKSFEARPADSLKESCEGILEYANADDDSTGGVVGPYVELLRKWHAK